jgi:hypothetical protein
MMSSAHRNEEYTWRICLDSREQATALDGPRVLSPFSHRPTVAIVRRGAASFEFENLLTTRHEKKGGE